MKKILFIGVMICIIFFNVGIINVSASDAYFVSDYGVSLSKEEYDFVSNFLYDGYQKSMTEQDYEIILGNGVNNDIERVEYNPIMPLGSTHTTGSKSLNISKTSLGSTTLVSIVATWTAIPLVKDYDLIGAYLDKVSLTGGVSTRVQYPNGNDSASYTKTAYNGVGASIKLPNVNTSNIIVSQVFNVTGSGHVYASYQHATKTVGLANSKKFTFSMGGFGNVFALDNAIYNSYDHMRGVDITI